MSNINISDVKFTTIGNQLIDVFACDGLLSLGGFKNMTPMECGQLTMAHKDCGHSFFHSESCLPQGCCHCEVKSVLCPREENLWVTEYQIQE